jgi:zinc protease
MRKKFLIFPLVAIMTLILVTSLHAGKKRKHPSKLKYPPLEVETPEVIDISLENGLEGFLIEDHEIPVVDVVILVKTYFPDRKMYGLNEMARWVMRNGGTEKWPSDKLNDELEFLPASIEVYGGDLSTQIYVNCLKRDLEHVLGIYADIIMNPAFPEDKVEMKRKKMLEDIRRKNDQPRSVVRREFGKLIYAGHPFGLENTKEATNAITRADLAAFHDKYFHPNNAIIGISGDVNENEIVGMLNKALEGWKKADVEIPDVPEVTEKEGESYNYIYRDINQVYMRAGHLGINYRNPDRCEINIMNYILGGGSFSSWITEEVRVKEGLAYSSGSFFGANPWAKGMFAAYAQTKSGEYSRALQLIKDQINRMREEGPTEEEVKKAIDSFLNSYVFEYESKSAVVRRLVDLKFQGLPLDTPEKDIREYENVTVDDVKRVARNYLQPDNLTILVVGDKDKFDRPLSDFGEVNVIELEEE